jgi:hypothetical protein
MLATIMLLTWVAVMAFCLCAGLHAIFKSWVPPWLRGGVASAREWGFGVLIRGLGVGLERLAFPIGLALLFVGLGVTRWAQMSRRRGRAGRDG